VIAGSYRRDTDGFAVTQIGLAFDGSVFLVKEILVWVLPSDYALKVDGKLTKLYPDGTVQGPSLRGRGYAFARDNSYYVLANYDPSNSTVGQFLVSMSPEKPMWAQTLAGRCSAPAVGNDGVAYVGCPEMVRAIYPGGTMKWSFDIRGHAASQPSIAEDGSVYFGCDDGNVYALSPDGELKWRFRTDDKVTSTPAIARNGTIFFGSGDRYLYAVGPDGKLKWKFKTGGQVLSATIGLDGSNYALSADGKLYALRDLEQNGGLWGQWAKWAGGMHNTWRGPTPN